MPDDAAALLDEKYVSLTTWKKDGAKVSTPMWAARDGAALVMCTPADSWKVKRIRRDSRVELAPCSRTGKLTTAAPPTPDSAVIDADQGETARVKDLLKAKYGIEFRVINLVEQLFGGGGRRHVVIRVVG